ELASQTETDRKREMCGSRPRVTINAAVLAAAIRIHARFESNVRAVVAGDNCLRPIAKILSGTPRPLPWPAVALRRRLISRVDINGIDVLNVDMQLFESISRTPGCASAVNRFRALRSLFNDRPIFFLCFPHVV